jgi:tRNA(Arg) A34 adenosine deaminase TadA
MRIALQMAERSMAAGGPPVGACLVRAGEVVASAHNSVIGELDVTAHAEITLIRQACRELRSLSLEGCCLYVTVEPCSMCLAACFYAGIQEIVFGAPISAMQALTASELCVAADELFAGQAAVDRAPQVSGGLLQADCLALLGNWQPLTGVNRQ